VGSRSRAEERLQFSPGERCPPFRADLAPRLPGNTWPEERLQKVLRNYAMEYVTSIVPETIGVLGPEEGGHLAGAAARLVGMHTFDEVAALLGGVEAGAAGFAKGLRPACPRTGRRCGTAAGRLGRHRAPDVVAPDGGT
jgi:hypothetical protein